MTDGKIRMIRAAFIVLAGLTAVRPAEAQGDASQALATRERLQSLLAGGPSGRQPLSDRERRLIEERLATGDFQIGDRLLIRVQGDSTFRDTLAVRTGPEVPLPNMPPLQLKGVLRSELQERARDHIAQFIRNPQVQAIALIRVGVLGSVLRPGYYSMAPDKPLSEALMAAGGLAADADLKKATIQRNGVERWSQDEVRRAMGQGVSLDGMGLQSGDELLVGRRSSGFGGTLPIITGLATLGLTVIALLLTKH